MGTVPAKNRGFGKYILKSPFSFSGKVQKSWSRYRSIYSNYKNKERISQPPSTSRTIDFKELNLTRASSVQYLGIRDGSRYMLPFHIGVS